MSSIQKITPFLWFNDNAEEAAKFYVSVFKNSTVGTISRYGESGAGASGRPKGSVMTVAFTLNGQEFVGLNGGPNFPFSYAVSFVVNCDSQQEIDYYWEKLCAGGAPEQCGWLKDKFGMSWQVVPSKLWEWMKDPAKSERVMQNVLKMVKLDLATLEKA